MDGRSCVFTVLTYTDTAAAKLQQFLPRIPSYTMEFQHVPIMTGRRPALTGDRYDTSCQAIDFWILSAHITDASPACAQRKTQRNPWNPVSCEAAEIFTQRTMDPSRVLVEVQAHSAPFFCSPRRRATAQSRVSSTSNRAVLCVRPNAYWNDLVGSDRDGCQVRNLHSHHVSSS